MLNAMHTCILAVCPSSLSPTTITTTSTTTSTTTITTTTAPPCASKNSFQPNSLIPYKGIKEEGKYCAAAASFLNFDTHQVISLRSELKTNFII